MLKYPNVVAFLKGNLDSYKDSYEQYAGHAIFIQTKTKEIPMITLVFIQYGGYSCLTDMGLLSDVTKTPIQVILSEAKREFNLPLKTGSKFGPFNVSRKFGNAIACHVSDCNDLLRGIRLIDSLLSNQVKVYESSKDNNK